MEPYSCFCICSSEVGGWNVVKLNFLMGFLQKTFGVNLFVGDILKSLVVQKTALVLGVDDDEQ